MSQERSTLTLAIKKRIYPIFIILFSAIMLLNMPGLPMWMVGLVEYEIISAEFANKWGVYFFSLPVAMTCITWIHFWLFHGVAKWTCFVLGIGHMAVVTFFIVIMIMMALA